MRSLVDCMAATGARMWRDSIRTALRTFAFIAVCVRARSCNLAHSHAIYFYHPNTQPCQWQLLYLRLFVRSLDRSFVGSLVYLLVCSLVRLLVECIAGTPGCGLVLYEQRYVRLHSLLPV